MDSMNRSTDASHKGDSQQGSRDSKVTLRSAIGRRFWSSDSSDGSDAHEEDDILDMKDDEGWEDVEPDLERIEVVSLFDNEVFTDVQSMLQHCREAHQFDLWQAQKDLNLEHLDLIKLVNYIRLEVQHHRFPPNVLTKSLFEDDKFLIPTLKDDSLLYSLEDFFQDINDDLLPSSLEHSIQDVAFNHHKDVPPLDGSLEISAIPRQALLYIRDLRRKFSTTLHKLHETQKRADLLQEHLDRNIRHLREMEPVVEEDSKDTTPNHTPGSQNDDIWDDPYGKLDTVRTEAYQKFISENADLVKGKVVLDVGCGTGILSMFCAKAGAKMVLAVEQSKIHHYAQQIVFENGFQDTIQVLHGTIQEVILPVDKVDVIVSEWMGYCLLYEGMLDSVIWARDRYLSKGGLMIPSYTTLRLAPLSCKDYVDERVHFWNEQYGFDMTAMTKQVVGVIDVNPFKPESVAGKSIAVLMLDLHCTTKADLKFERKPFTLTSEDDNNLDGFLIWFDVFFLRPREELQPKCITAEEFAFSSATSGTTISQSFTTGPHGPETHWMQGALLANYSACSKKQYAPDPLVKGEEIKGEMCLDKANEDGRGLFIAITWTTEGREKEHRNSWKLL